MRQHEEPRCRPDQTGQDAAETQQVHRALRAKRVMKLIVSRSSMPRR